MEFVALYQPRDACCDGGNDKGIAQPIDRRAGVREAWCRSPVHDAEDDGSAADRDGNFEIYVMNADGGNPVRLTNNTVSDTEPDWSR